MNFTKYPEDQGLYESRFERDACGMGFIVDIKGKKSHNIIIDALSILLKLTHRGSTRSDDPTGDGAGILTQIPHKLFESKIDNLPASGQYGVGVLFLPLDSEERNIVKGKIDSIINEFGLSTISYRTVETNEESIGEIAINAMPVIEQIFITRNESESEDYERLLFKIRKTIETRIKGIYSPSFSHRTIVYKGMLSPTQVKDFYVDLSNDLYESAIALVHSRFSTNTFPSWERAHPYRYIIHNGEINTLQGNINAMKAREADFNEEFSIVDESLSDTGILDNALEYLYMGGYSLEEAVMMMIPEPWQKNKEMPKYKSDFYKYYSCTMEPWDGPASISFTDGIKIGAVLDRNGLRPSRYYITKDNKLILSSEVGVVESVKEEDVLKKGRLQPGRMLLVDTVKGEIINDYDLKKEVASRKPYSKWLEKGIVSLDDVKATVKKEEYDVELYKNIFGYTFEDSKYILNPMVVEGIDPIGAMGKDNALAVLSDKPRPLFDYFKQLFAQVTNPPIDALREELVTSTRQYIGKKANILKVDEDICKQIEVLRPIVSDVDFAKLTSNSIKGHKSFIFDITYEIGSDFNEALELFFSSVKNSILKDGIDLVTLSDRNVSDKRAPFPILLASSGLNQYLIKEKLRNKVDIIIETAEAREVHHLCTLLGFGANIIYPYLAIDTIVDNKKRGFIPDFTEEECINRYISTANKGIIKVMSKMGISTVQSYQGAQIFEAVGISSAVIDKFFTNTTSKIQGVTVVEIEQDLLTRHKSAYDFVTLDSGSKFQYRARNDAHLYNPRTIHLLQSASHNNNYETFKEFEREIDDHKLIKLRDLLEIDKTINKAIEIDEVESVDSIVKRFKIGAMSFGSISREAHETLARAMNKLGGKSNTGEGGEEFDRLYDPSRCSRIKQVASGRFGVTSNYLLSADEIQIKMAQGAKPGEGGQLHGKKVLPWVAKARNTTTGVGLISPPPHHDIYSIEDLAELIFDLKNANRYADINVKLTSLSGVGIVASGVAKGKADSILISGFDGGTGASPRTSTYNAGVPWEIGLAETHQTLKLNNLRKNVKLEVDGKILTGKDLAVACMLGAEEFAFATAPLIVLGCVMMRVCNLNTCPVGIATQDDKLRKYFVGKEEHLINYMRFMAQSLREIMASIGVKSINELIGQSKYLKQKDISHYKASKVDLSKLLHLVDGVDYKTTPQDHELSKTADINVLLDKAAMTIEKNEKVTFDFDINNTNRAFGTILGYEITKKYPHGLEEDTLTINIKGSCGQSLAAFSPKGITYNIEGDTNDFLGKGLTGSKIIVKKPVISDFDAEKNVITGNVSFYGATGGEAYINGIAGERFCVRNSGAVTVVEGVGDHGCEYMTGGIAVILGSIGRNFAAGMSGGVAYFIDSGKNVSRVNTDMVYVEDIETDKDINRIKRLITAHVKYTDSKLAAEILNDFDSYISRFKKVIPKDYKRMITAIEKAESEGLSGINALIKAYEDNYKS